VSDTREPATLDAATLQPLLTAGRGPQIIDVRTPGEFETTHIPGSVNVPLDVLREHRDELLQHLDEQVVLVCRSGQRATTACQALDVSTRPGPPPSALPSPTVSGLPTARILQGGLAEWQSAGAPVRTGRQRWDLERQVRLVAGSIVLAAVLASIAFEPAKWIAALIGAGLTVAALTNTCAMGMLLAKLPTNRGPRTDLNAIVAALADSRAGRLR
jgi:rhodanese-related sulfurtransferase